MGTKTNTQIIYKNIPNGLPTVTETFEILKTPIDIKNIQLKEDEILVRTLYLSLDPYMRVRMRDPAIKSYFPALLPGKIIQGLLVGEVIKIGSGNSKFSAGDIIEGFGNWEEYTVLNYKKLAGMQAVRKIARNDKIPVSYALGAVGMPGISAYAGLHKICEPFVPGQTLYVSAASGAVGQVVGQYAKAALGLRVVGSAGDDKKVEYLLKELHFDAAFNYKKYDEDLVGILKETCPKGIDIYFENVGGKMLDAVLINANDNARVVACGMISQYNLTNPEPVYQMAHVVWKKIRIEGFIVSDEMGRYADEAREVLGKLVEQGKIKYTESVTKGIQNAPQAFIEMLSGKNFGKAIVQVADLN